MIELVRGVRRRLPATALALSLVVSVPIAAGASHGGDDWTVVESPNQSASRTSSVLNDVTCVSPTDCWAVGRWGHQAVSRTLTLRWDGSSWEFVPSPSPHGSQNQIESVTCPGPEFCWAVGQSGGQNLIQRWNGSSWSTVPAPNVVTGVTGGLDDVTCVSESTCWAVGHYTTDGSTQQLLILRWNGISWSAPSALDVSPPPFTALKGVACGSASVCWAVGSSGNQTLLMRWDGTGWTSVEPPNVGTISSLLDVTCVSASQCWAVGHQRVGSATLTLVQRWDGASWVVVASANTTESLNILSDVACSDGSGCWAVGNHSVGGIRRTLVLRWEGASWNIVASPNTTEAQHNALNGVVCDSDGCWAAGYHYTGTGVIGDGFSPNHTVVQRWDGASWSRVPSSNGIGPDDNVLKGVSCTSQWDCWAVGRYWAGPASQTLIQRWDGATWTTVGSPNTSEVRANLLNDVTCVSASECWAVGSSQPGVVAFSLVQRWDGTSWQVFPSPNVGPVANNILSAVTCRTSSDCWAVGHYRAGQNDFTLTMHWDGTSWSVVGSPNAGGSGRNYLTGVSCPSEQLCWAAGYNVGANGAFQNLVMRWAGSSWELVEVPNTGTGTVPSNQLTGVECSSESDCWAVGYYVEGLVYRTLILRWNGTSWTIVESPSVGGMQHNFLNGVTCPEASDCVAVGYSYPPGQTSLPDPASRTLVLRWNGVTWTVDPTPNAVEAGENVLSAVACVTTTYCWSVGNLRSGDATRTLAVRFGVQPDIPVIPTLIGTPEAGSLHASSLVTVAGSSAPEAEVAILAGTVQIGAAVADGDGVWSVELAFADGAHTITAATGESVSPSVTFGVDTVAPDAPVISTPTQDAVLGSGTVTVGGTAEPGSHIALLHEGAELGGTQASGTGTWSVGLTLDDGTYSVTAAATDAAGNTGPASPPRTFTIDTAVVVAVTFVTDPIRDSNVANVRVEGTTSPGASVEVVVSDGVRSSAPKAGSVDATGAWTATGIDVGALANGSVTAVATATGPSGSHATASRTATKSVTSTLAPTVAIAHDGFGYLGPDHSPQAIEITITHNGPQAEATVDLSATDSQGSVRDLGGHTVAMGESKVVVLDGSALADGPLVATAIAEGSEASASVVLDRGTPSVTVDDPGVKLSVPMLLSPRFTGTASDTTSPIRSVVVTLRQGSTVVDKQNAKRHTYGTQTTWEYATSRFLTPGSYTITAQSIDEAGNLSEAVTRDVTIL